MRNGSGSSVRIFIQFHSGSSVTHKDSGLSFYYPLFFPILSFLSKNLITSKGDKFWVLLTLSFPLSLCMCEWHLFMYKCVYLCMKARVWSWLLPLIPYSFILCDVVSGGNWSSLIWFRSLVSKPEKLLSLPPLHSLSLKHQKQLFAWVWIAEFPDLSPHARVTSTSLTKPSPQPLLWHILLGCDQSGFWGLGVGPSALLSAFKFRCPRSSFVPACKSHFWLSQQGWSHLSFGNHLAPFFEFSFLLTSAF